MPLAALTAGLAACPGRANAEDHRDGAPLAATAPVEAGPTVQSPEVATASDASAGLEHRAYRTAVQTGDSMVGGGLCLALGPKYTAEGTRFVRDVWEAASIIAFDDSDHIPRLIAKYDPDLVLVTLGANDVFALHPEVLGRHIDGVVKKIGQRDCYWIGPPAWKGDRGLVDVIRAHASPCRFFDSSRLVLERRADGIHPTDKAGRVWADAFWAFQAQGPTLTAPPQGTSTR